VICLKSQNCRVIIVYRRRGRWSEMLTRKGSGLGDAGHYEAQNCRQAWM